MTVDDIVMTLMATPEGRRDPYPHYERLRALAPVARSDIVSLVLFCVMAYLSLPQGTADRAQIHRGLQRAPGFRCENTFEWCPYRRRIQTPRDSAQANAAESPLPTP